MVTLKSEKTKRLIGFLIQRRLGWQVPWRQANRALGVMALATALTGSYGAFAASKDLQLEEVEGGYVGLWVPQPPLVEISPVQSTLPKKRIADRNSSSTSLGSAAATGPQPYTFFPQAGTLWQDLFINNFVDLDPSTGILDFDCTNFTYDGHGGIDSQFGWFREMAIGIPIFAALDGTVIDLHDGEFDMNTTPCAGCPVNYVTLDHGGGQRTQYVHLKKNSISVSLNQFVPAGTQLGLTGSSGSSTAPHLHFTSIFNGQLYEPFAGPCRPGPSNWVNQIPIRRDTYARDFYFYLSDTLPDNATDTRVGSFVMENSKLVWFRLFISNVPVGSYRVRYQRPDGVYVIDNTGTTNQAFRIGEWIFGFFLNLDMAGTWRMLFDVNGQTIADAPFNVVASPDQLVNHPPYPITASFDPPVAGPDDVLFCRVQTDLYRRDPDYDIMRYHYQWTVDGTVVRDVVSAVLSDALAKGAAPEGSVVSCSVTPSDGIVDGEGDVVALTITDTTPPDTAIDSKPSNPTELTTADFTFHSTESGSSFQCQLDGGGYSACVSPKSYTGLALGSHTFDVKATDAAGNPDPTPASYVWTITTLDTIITPIPVAATKSTTAVFNFTSTDPTSTFACSLDNAAFTACTSPKTYTRLKPGAHNFKVRATAGSQTDPTPANFDWVVDKTAPNTSITSGPPPVTNNSSATFEFTSTEAGSTFQCKLDKGAFTLCTSQQVYNGLSIGTHKLQVRATDMAGNVDKTPAKFNWKIQ